MSNLVMVADDDAAFAGMLNDFLSMKGYQVVVVPDGMQAGVKAGQLKPRLIVMDIQMPGAYGTAAYTTLLRDPSTASIPIIFCTGVPLDKAEAIVPKGKHIRLLSKTAGLVTIENTMKELLGP